MDINHGNLYNELLALVLGRYALLHANVNGMGAEYRVTETWNNVTTKILLRDRV